MEQKESNMSKFEVKLQKLLRTYESKNHDYGNSFEESLDEEGIIAARVRMRDKWNRFVTLSKSEIQNFKDESIIDTLEDLANYCIMAALWLEKHSEKSIPTGPIPREMNK